MTRFRGLRGTWLAREGEGVRDQRCVGLKAKEAVRQPWKKARYVFTDLR